MSHIGRAGPPDITDTYSLLVLNISFRTTVEDLFPLFDKYGKVVDIHIPRDRRTGESRGFAFVRYKYGDEAQKAVDRLDGRQVDGREIAVQFAKYGPNAERIHKGRILEPIAKVRSPKPRERDYHRRSRSRSVDRYERDRYRERERSSRRRSRSRSYSPGYRRGRGRDRYDDERSYGSRSPRSASPPRRSRSSRRSPSPRKRVSSRSPPLSRSASPDRRSPKGRSVSPRRSLSPRKGSPDGRLDNSRSPSPHQSDEK